jgi:hypothetical protein
MTMRPIRFARSLFSIAATGLLLAAAILTTPTAKANSDPVRPIAVNQTDGYADDRLVAFTYFMNFDCVHDPFKDLDRNGKAAAVDPDEFQSPRCVVGEQSTIDPAGKPVSETEKLYVIVPFFDADHDGEAATPELAAALNSLFGFVPDAFDPTPGVPVQCPEPGLPLTRHKGDFGTCTMHPRKLDLGPVLASLGKVPPGSKVEVPTPNHSHIIRDADFGAVWWQIVVVLVNDQAVWPNVEGTTGLNSVEALRAAQSRGQASKDIPSNFFLFFDSRQFAHAH